MRTQAIYHALAIVLLCPFASAQWVQTNGPYRDGHNDYGVPALAVRGAELFAAVQYAGGEGQQA